MLGMSRSTCRVGEVGDVGIFVGSGGSSFAKTDRELLGGSTGVERAEVLARGEALGEALGGLGGRGGKSGPVVGGSGFLARVVRLGASVHAVSICDQSSNMILGTRLDWALCPYHKLHEGRLIGPTRISRLRSS